MPYLQRQPPAGSTKGRETEVFLGPQPITIGRSQDCEVTLETTAVSRRHARVRASDADYLIEDLGSRNGTFLNGNRIDTPQPLTDGDVILLCGERLIYRTGEPDSTTAAGEAENATLVTMVDRPADRIVSSIQLEPQARVCRVEPERALAAILEISQSLRSGQSIDELLTAVLDRLFDLYPQADHGVILLREPDGAALVPSASKRRRDSHPRELQVSRTVIDRAFERQQAILSADASTDASFDSSRSLAVLPIRSLMCVPLFSQDRQPLGVIELHTESAESQFTPDCLDVLVSVSNIAAVAIENARLHQRALLQARMARDLEHAQNVQRSLLPTGYPVRSGYRFAAHYAAALSVGGDYYDFIELADGSIAIAIADVSGKGASAALMMAKLSSELPAALLRCPDPAAALHCINENLYASPLEDQFVTMLLMFLDNHSHRLRFANAGHPPPLLRRADGTVSELSALDARIGVPLNVVDDPSLGSTNGEFTLEMGDHIILYTDGLSETATAQGNMFGSTGIESALAGANPDAESLVDALIHAATTFAGTHPPRDDVTVVALGRDLA